MISLILSLLIAPPQDAPEDVGRVTFTAGVCGALGWIVDPAEGERMAEATVAANMGRGAGDPVAEATAAAEAVEAQFTTEFEAVTDQAAFRTWAAMIEARCDATAEAYPALLRRGTDTAAEWAVLQERALSRLQP
ncbi:hypothetical protein [Brevundimonas sp.]|uniref:hypothetical protein n=1 Tax=Brevundimonas sp. TaxID=1871086 RepID=UPI002AB84EA0|nr:hypothetical protein [Brevundimonas sp.]MDZ4362993.1 hypothetical protein [Brevundimonas sp.]